MNSGSYEVGYGSPPRQHQFKKGQSGNPRGRPRKSRNRKTIVLGNLHDLVLAEAERVISVREGEASHEMTVQEAFVRSISVRAIKGDRFHGKLFHQLVSSAQKQKAEHQQSLFEEACLYKRYWEREFERCKREGRHRPEPVPHPEDVIVSPRTGEVRIEGPMTPEEKEVIDRAVALRDEIIARLETLGHLEFADPDLRRKLRDRQIRRVEAINERIPPEAQL